jgi:hypothetical protein
LAGVVGRGAAIDAVNDPLLAADPDGCAGLLLLQAAAAAIAASATYVRIFRYCMPAIRKCARHARRLKDLSEGRQQRT